MNCPTCKAFITPESGGMGFHICTHDVLGRSAPDQSSQDAWDKMRTPAVAEFIEKYHLKPIDPWLFHEMIEFAHARLTPDQKFELLLWFVSQI